MQDTFIGSIVDKVVRDNTRDYSGQLFVFPSRRACLYFRHEFSSRVKRSVWAPSAMTAQDFMGSLSSSTIPDYMSLVFDLFEVYKKFFSEESFESFYPWGQMLLQDFDEIDKHLVNAHGLFGTLSDIKKIESDFAVSEEDIKEALKFWRDVLGNEKNISLIKKEFIRVWNSLEPIYTGFKELLKSRGLAYEGMAYRQIVENIDSISIPYNHITFAGLYALSASEKSVIYTLSERKMATVYMDADQYYSDEKTHEAGRFVQQIKKTEAGESWPGNYFGQGNKNIYSIAVPLQLGQAKALGSILNEMIGNNGLIPSETAIILPDENMLLPVLYSIPAAVEKINVTMGYELANTPMYHLYKSLSGLIRHARNKANNDKLFGREVSFYFKDVIRVLQHPYVFGIDPHGISEIINDIKRKNRIYIPAPSLLSKKNPEICKLIFEAGGFEDDVTYYYTSIINSLIRLTEDSGEKTFSGLDKEFIFAFYTLLNRLGTLLRKAAMKANEKLFSKLFDDIIRTSRMPFTGEPLQGLQIMGFLETRALDFENVFILSMNEGILPQPNPQGSYIPYTLRKSFHLPVFEDRDAITSYHFYRLLQRAKNIWLFYDSEVKSIVGVEKSRYLLQIKHELVRKYGNINYTENTLYTPLKTQVSRDISIAKGDKVMSRLRSYHCDSTYDFSAGKSYHPSFSATALSMYINCPLQFYFRYIAGLKEVEEVEEDIDEKTFGSLFHKVMELVYLNETLVDETLISAKIKSLDEIVRTAFSEVLPGHDADTGKNLLSKSMITELAKRTLWLDKTYAPFRISGLEKQLKMSFRFDDNRDPVLLSGIIDRIDVKEEEGLRVVDYKTGRVKLSGAEIPEYFTDPANKIPLQAYLYGLMLARSVKNERIKLGIYPVRKPSEGVKYLNSAQNIPLSQFETFEEGLRKIFREMFNPGIPFSQTQDLESCNYCPYKELCGR